MDAYLSSGLVAMISSVSRSVSHSESQRAKDVLEEGYETKDCGGPASTGSLYAGGHPIENCLYKENCVWDGGNIQSRILYKMAPGIHFKPLPLTMGMYF